MELWPLVKHSFTLLCEVFVFFFLFAQLHRLVLTLSLVACWFGAAEV